VAAERGKKKLKGCASRRKIRSDCETIVTYGELIEGAVYNSDIICGMLAFGSVF
jgi:hypothetical protein